VSSGAPPRPAPPPVLARGRAPGRLGPSYARRPPAGTVFDAAAAREAVPAAARRAPRSKARRRGTPNGTPPVSRRPWRAATSRPAAP